MPHKKMNILLRTFLSFRHQLPLALTIFCALLVIGLFIAWPHGSSALTNGGSITSFGSPITEDFNTLAGSGTNVAWTDNSTIVGWYSTRTTYNAGTGSSNTGSLYSFGTAAGDRALGSVSSGGTGIIYTAVKLTNNTGGTITSLDIAYTGEQWRNGGNTTAHKLTFEYQIASAGTITDANAPTTGWISVSALDFTGPIATATAAALDGNAPANRTAKSANLPITITAGQEIWLRWVDVDDPGSDHGLAVDDLSVTANGMTVNQAITTSCPSPISATSGAVATGNVSATDPDGIITSAIISAITPSNPGTITLTGFTAAASAGDTATATVNVGATTPAGNYTVNIQWANNDSPNPQTGTCAVTVNVAPGTLTLIHDIQGATETPNFVGNTVIIEGIVVGDYQTSISGLQGFFVEEESSDWDANGNTSEGIFIFDGAIPAVNVNVGDKVKVTGTVTNFGGPPGLTELTSPTVMVLSMGNTLPPVQAVTLPVTAQTDLEKYEGMLVNFSTLYVTRNDDLGVFGELTLATSRQFQPTNAIDPNDAAPTGTTTSGTSNAAAVNTQESLNNNSTIILNDGRGGSYPNPIPFIGAGTNSTIRLGDRVSNLTGVMDFAFGTYRVEPTTPVAFAADNPRTNAPDSVGSPTLRAASFNIENFFVDPPDSTGRGAGNAAEFTRQLDKIVAALKGLNADVVGLIELEKAGGAAAAQAIVNALNTQGIGTYAVISDPATLIGTDPEIKSGIIYRTSAVTPVGSSMTDTAAAAGTYSRDPITQLFKQNSNDEQFYFVVNHLRSKGCGNASGLDADQNDGQGCYNERRRQQALALANYVNNTLVPVEPDVLMVGDFNAYLQEDPIDILRAAGFQDVLGEDGTSYSYFFDKEVGRLDHAFATISLYNKITGSTIWHINADEPDIFDYNTENKPDDRYAATPFRSADHDPLLIGLNLTPPPSVAITSTSITEGTGGTTTLNFTVSISEAIGSVVTVNYATSNGTALSGSDYADSNGTVAFDPMNEGAAQTISIPINPDCLVEGNETFTVTLSNAVNAVIATGQGTATGTIIDDDLPGTIGIEQAAYSVSEGGQVIIKFVRSGGTAENVSFNYAVTADTATQTTDYDSVPSGVFSSTLTFACGETMKTLTLSAVDDNIDEANETLNVAISNLTNGATAGTAAAVVTINDNDAAPTVSLNNPSVTEGNSGTVDLTFTAMLTNSSSSSLTFNALTSALTATADIDYQTTPVPASITFAPGETSKTIVVKVIGDLLDEADETLQLTLQENSISVASSIGTIINDDNPPTIAINDVTVAEGHAGTANATFIISLSAPSGKIVTVDAASANDTATAGSDYVALAATTVTFAPGETSKMVTVAVNGDLLDETNETFFVNLSGASNATILDNQGLGTITDDDAQPALSVVAASITEGNSGTKTLTITVALSVASGLPVSVNYATSNGSATAGSDYVAASDTLNFAAGETSKTFSVTINGDTLFEPDETFTVLLSSASNATLPSIPTTMTILNDDGEPTIAITDALVTEGNSGLADLIFNVTLSAPSSAPITVNYATQDNTATAGTDYVANSGQITFAAGETGPKQIMVKVIGDLIFEDDETLFVNLTSPPVVELKSNSQVATRRSKVDETVRPPGGTRATGTIRDDDLSLGIPGTPVAPDGVMNDQKPGSVLVFPVYTSNSTSVLAENTRFVITNLNPTQSVTLHLFFVDGRSCSVRDSYLCLSQSQTTTFSAADYDPDTTGYLVVVAVDRNSGCPTNFNFLAGDAYVKFASGHSANLAAWSFAALKENPATCDIAGAIATLNFDGVNYNAAPRTVAVDNFASSSDDVSTLVVLSRLGGNFTEQAEAIGSLFGLLYDDQERPYSFQTRGGCQIVERIANTFPLTAPRLTTAIQPGHTGWLKLYGSEDKALLGATLTRSRNSQYSDGHNLHALTFTSRARLTIPVFPPSCR